MIRKVLYQPLRFLWPKRKFRQTFESVVTTISDSLQSDHQEFENPYPDPGWTRISEFEYATPLHLYRAIEAFRSREREDADYIVWRDYTVRFKLDNEDEHREITVPRGMLTDLSSVPSVARSVIGRVGPHLEASIVHDFLYIAWQDLEERGPRDEDREFADTLMRVALKKAGVSGWQRFLIYNAVRWFGKGAYVPRYVHIPWVIVTEEADNAGLKIAPSKNLLEELANRGDKAIKDHPHRATEVEANLTRWVRHMIDEARAQKIPELNESTFKAAQAALCPFWPFC